MENLEKPNIIFLLVDSFRSDKCFGNKKTSITPNLDSLVNKGTIFPQTICSAPVTIPSVSCIFTGQHPFNAIIRGGNRAKLNPDIYNFISNLKSSGYSTTAIVSKLLKLSGLTDDFDQVIETPGHDGLYDGVGEKILSTFEEKKLGIPWFFYIHLLDVHGTARGFPEKFNDKKYGMNQYERMVSAMDVWLGKIFEKINFDNTLVILTADHSSDVGIYTPDMEFNKNNVSNGDRKNTSLKLGEKISSKLPISFKSKMKKIYAEKKGQIEIKKKNEILDQINQKNISIYKKRILEHSIRPGYDVFDDRFVVPLIFAGYGITTPSIINQQVRSIDIFPTIFELIQIQNNAKIHGKSLLPLIKGLPMDESPAYMESIANWNEAKKATILDVVGLRYKNFKYFRSRNNSNENVGLYDLNVDPHEEHNIAKENPEKIIEMDKILSNIRERHHEELKEQPEELRDYEEEKMVEAELKKLGYI